MIPSDIVIFLSTPQTHERYLKSQNTPVKTKRYKNVVLECPQPITNVPRTSVKHVLAGTALIKVQQLLVKTFPMQSLTVTTAKTNETKSNHSVSDINH